MEVAMVLREMRQRNRYIENEWKAAVVEDAVMQWIISRYLSNVSLNVLGAYAYIFWDENPECLQKDFLKGTECVVL